MMLRAKSPFKKRSPKIDDSNQVPATNRLPLDHYSSIQEFQDLQRQQHLLNSNAWAQQKVLSRTNSQVDIGDPTTPLTSMGDIIEALEPSDRNSLPSMGPKTPKAKKKVPAPLKLVPDTAKIAVPTQRDSLENKKHIIMQAQLNMAAHDSNDEYSHRARESMATSPNASVEHIARPKSPGKKLFQKIFRQHTSSETPPKISPEFEVTPEKAVKILGKESLSRKKDVKQLAKKLSRNEEKMVSKLDFKCAGEDNSRSRANTASSIVVSTPSTEAAFHAPTDREIRSIGGVGRYATRVPTVAVPRAVSETATMKTISAAIEEKYQRGSGGYALEQQHKHLHLQYINDAIPPTPPSKDSRREKMRPAVTEVPAMDVSAVLKDEASTPATAFRVVSEANMADKGAVPLAQPVPRYGGSDYLNLVLNKPSVPAMRGASSIRSAYGFVISPSAELADGSSFNSPVAHFIESPIIPRSAGLPSSREASLGSKGECATSPRVRSLSRRWSDTSLTTWKARTPATMPCLPPTFYSPCNFTVPAQYRNFTRPSANDDPSLYYLPQTTTGGDLESFASRTCSETNPTPPTSAESSFTPTKDAEDKILDKDATPVNRQRRFIVKKRCSSNIAVTARAHAVHGLGLSPLINETMHHVSSSNGSDASFRDGPASAVPAPLNVFPHGTIEPLPAKEELDAFMTMHLHLDQSTHTIHHFINRKYEQSIQAMNNKHDETLKILSTSFNNILAKIDGMDEQNQQNAAGLTAFKTDMNNKIMEMADMLQGQVLDPMSKVMESNAQLDKSVSLLMSRIVELEKNQTELVELIKTKNNLKDQAISLPPMDVSLSPAMSTHPSPHHSFNGQNFAVSYPTPYSSGSATSGNGPVYPYVPYYAEGGAYAGAPGWTGQALDASFAKLPREQRLQQMQGRYVPAGNHLPMHPAYKNGHRVNGGGLQGYGKDSANEI